jgi:hypothetical protein
MLIGDALGCLDHFESKIEMLNQEILKREEMRNCREEFHAGRRKK